MSTGGKLPGFLESLSSYLVTNITVTLFWIFFFVLNRTTVTGRRNVGTAKNTLLLSHHQSMIDSFLVGTAVYYPKSWFNPHLLPWNPAAAENFFNTPVLAWLARNWKCIPIREGRRDMKALARMIQLLPHGVMTIFPHGGRSRDGSVGSGRAGAGLVVLSTHPRVIPVAIDGMDKVLPIGSCIPRIFKRIHVSYGPPVDYSDFLDQPRSKETAQAIVDRAMERIRIQLEEIRGTGGSAR